MEPSAASLVAKVASSAVGPLVRSLFVREGPGAALVEKPQRISGLVSFRGEKRVLAPADLERLAGQLVRRVNRASGPHERAVPEAEEESVASAVAATLTALGEIGLTDVEAVGLGHEAFARVLLRQQEEDATVPPHHRLSADAATLHTRVLDTACLHVLEFFTKRSAFVPRTLVEQSRQLNELVRLTDLLAERLPSRTAEDARFEQQYTEHLARKHGELTIYGLDTAQAREWRLDSAYVSLEATHDAGHGAGLPLPADEALAGHERVLLRGGAGSGKTTLVQWLAVTAARPRDIPAQLHHLVGRVPFVLPLRRVARDGRLPTPDAFLHAVGSSAAGAQPDGWADRVLRAGRGLLLVDGIDEIPGPERESVRRWLRDLLGDFPGNLWLVTARPSAVREDWLTREGFTELSLAPMSRADVSAFVHRWTEAAEAAPESAEALLRQIRTHPDLARLAVNPLMCGLLCALHRERHGVLPRGRKELYDAALSMLLERRDRERGIPAEDLGTGGGLTKEPQIQLIQKLAHWMIRNGRAELDHEDAVAQLARALPAMPHLTAPPEAVLRHLLDRSGLLREPAPGRVDFVHRTFQDYLAAKAAVEEGDFPLVVDNAHKDQWEDVVRMAVAHARPAERTRILRGLLALGTVRTTLLATACLEQATELDPAVYAEVTSRTAGLVPPRDAESARRLAESAGPLVLPMLPGPDEVPDEATAHAVVTTATRIPGDASLTYLTRWRTYRSLAVRRQLAWSWRRFDTTAYAEEILAHLDPSGLYFTIRDEEQLEALHALGGRPRVQTLSRAAASALAAHPLRRDVTHLWLCFHDPEPEAWDRHFPRLHTLVLPHGERLAPVAGKAPRLTVLAEHSLPHEER
ncbi:NACHT domain-containing protein [Streptomyces sp. HNM0574]|uniref:NACHT domain-containing protein n=1 Tax=Streptomyces sp. HNM0574 TaxID=2714954 RepID=UPI00146A5358|nr:NACHT domain-containing protein [Streptomyces sp. HNM0574]NLU67966.1 NACHT domain-containing protein [Streptomyces sp. HNM0574]